MVFISSEKKHFNTEYLSSSLPVYLLKVYLAFKKKPLPIRSD